jgi:hypothetical protein
MVKKTAKIVSKPTNNPSPDQWVTGGGVDPELQLSKSVIPIDEAQDKPKAYPHRVSFDMETDQYKRLKRASFEQETPMNEILREAIESWLKSRNY